MGVRVGVGVCVTGSDVAVGDSALGVGVSAWVGVGVGVGVTRWEVAVRDSGEGAGVYVAVGVGVGVIVSVDEGKRVTPAEVEGLVTCRGSAVVEPVTGLSVSVVVAAPTELTSTAESTGGKGDSGLPSPHATSGPTSLK